MVTPDVAGNRTTPGLGTTVLAPVGFLAAYLAVDPLSGAVADRSLPLPGSPASEVAAYYAANPAAVGITAGLQILSVACLAVFVTALAPALRAAGARWLPGVGYLSTAAMVVSSALSIVLAAVAASASDTTVVVLRQASFYAGGVVHVVTLGVFVLGAALLLGGARLVGAATRWFGFVAGGIAVLSILSLVAYYANAALPLGRVLSMVWAIVAGVVIYRRVRAELR